MAGDKVTGTVGGGDDSREILDGKLDGGKATFNAQSGMSDAPKWDFVAYREGDGLKVEITSTVVATGERRPIGSGVLKAAK
jgi:hypothetical protein